MMQNLLDKALEKKTDADAAVVKVDARFAAERSKVKPNQVNGRSMECASLLIAARGESAEQL